METNILFSKSLLFNVKDSPQSVSKKYEYNVQVDCHLGLNQREVIIRISDDEDPFFIFISTINQDDFDRIKSSQGLLIDFTQFPTKFIELLDMCFAQQDKPESKFILCLTFSGKDRSSAVLEVVEVNPIRHLTHLLLKIPSANESFIKTSLLNSFRTLKCEKERLEVNLSNAQMQLSNQSSGRAKEMERIKNEYELLLRENDIKSRKEIEQEKEKLNEMSLREADHKQKIEELESRLFEVEEKYKREDELRCEGLVHTNGELQKRLFMLEKAMREKDNELEKTKEYLVEEQSKLKKYMELYDERHEMVQKQDEQTQKISHDLRKAHDIIGKLQAEIKSTHSKLNLLNKVANKQDEVVGAKESVVRKLEMNLRQCAEQVKVKENEYQLMRKELDALNEKLNVSQEQVKTNENVIDFLTKQVIELQGKHGIRASNVIKLNSNAMTSVVTKPGITTSAKAAPQLPHVSLFNKPAVSKTDPKIIAQRNALFGCNKDYDPFK